MIINKKKISNNSKTYFIADIAANHDGDIKKAFELIYQAKKSGADAAKFQHFSAETIVSDKSFSSMKSKLSHQSKWKKSVFQVYKDASLNLDWTPKLYNYCKKIGIDFFTSPYSIDLVDHVDKFVPAYKIGSGDITWLEIIKHISKKKKPVILASGASNMQDVVRAIKTIKKYNSNICIMQCNTNYTASEENFNYINLNVLKSYRKKFKNIILGLSDHTLGHSTVLDMIKASRELELSLGSDVKKIEKNELDTAIVQRRSLHFLKDYKINEKIRLNDFIALRPCPRESVEPYEINKIKDKRLKKNKHKGDVLLWKDLK